MLGISVPLAKPVRILTKSLLFLTKLVQESLSSRLISLGMNLAQYIVCEIDKRQSENPLTENFDIEIKIIIGKLNAASS